MSLNNTAEEMQPNKAEMVSSKMYGIADKVDTLNQPTLYETFNSAGTEFANGNYDKGQRLLENNGFWNDEIRGVASEANQANREQDNTAIFEFDEAKRTINSYAKNLEDQGERQDLDSATQIESLIRGMDRPGQSGIDGIDDTLKYIEGLLQTKTRLDRQMTPAMKEQWEEQRGIRDSLLAEKSRRIEQIKQAQRGGERLSEDRNSATRVLENLYDNAGVSEAVPSRQELTKRTQRMSAEELHFLNDDLRKAAVDFNRTRDQKSLDATLTDLVTKKFTKKAVIETNKKHDETELENVRSKLNLPSNTPMDSASDQTGSKESTLETGSRINSYEEIFNDPILRNALSSESGGYTENKGAASMVEVFKSLYPNIGELSQRLDSLIAEFNSTFQQTKVSNPGKSEEAYENFATNQLFQSLGSKEKQAMEQFLDANYQKMGGSGQRLLSSKQTFHDFVLYINRMK